MSKASVEWEPETDDDLRLERGKRMVLRCKVHGITDDMILEEYGTGNSQYVCRLCHTKPCKEHGHDYVTLLGKKRRNVCIICEPRMLERVAQSRRREYEASYR